MAKRKAFGVVAEGAGRPRGASLAADPEARRTLEALRMDAVER